MPFTPTAQYAKNTKMTVQFIECNKRMVCYAKNKIFQKNKSIIERELEELQYTCGSSFDAIDGYENSSLSLIHVRKNIDCKSPIEVPYYGANHSDICVHCGSNDSLIEEEGYFPMCDSCRVSEKK